MNELMPKEKYKKEFPKEVGYRYYDMTPDDELARKRCEKTGVVRVRIVNKSGVEVVRALISRGWFE